MSLISVIMPIYNGERFVAEALESVQRQEVADLEIIVVDDGSTDGSAAYVEALAAVDGRIRLLRGARSGVAAARNRGLRAARGDLIAFIDCDDVMPEGRLARNLKLFASDPTVDVILGDIVYFSELGADGKPAGGTPYIRLQTVNLPAHVFRRAAFERVGLFDESFEQAEDGDLILRMREAGVKLVNDGEVALYYRRHPDNMTNDTGTAKRAMVQMVHASLKRRRAAGAVSDVPKIVRVGEEAR